MNQPGASRPQQAQPGRQLTPASPVLLTPASVNGQYTWTLNLYPRVSDVCQYLLQELKKVLGEPLEARFEPASNVFLLCCAISDAADNAVLGSAYDFSKVADIVPAARPAVRACHRILEYRRRRREGRFNSLMEWRARWQASVERYVHDWLFSLGAELDASAAAIQKLLLDRPFSQALLNARIEAPAAFRSQDVTPFDVLSLAVAYYREVRGRTEPILVVGLRPTGSYFTPLVAAYLRSQGLSQVTSLTVQLNKPLGAAEEKSLAGWARKGAHAAIIDESTDDDAFGRAVDVLRTAGYTDDRITLLSPSQPAKKNWHAGANGLGLCTVRLITLPPQSWFKRQQLQPERVEQRLQSWFLGNGCKSAVLVKSEAVETFNRALHTPSPGETAGGRLKQIYQFQLKDSLGQERTVYVLAKSVGWGWLSYPALLTAHRLAAFVPPVLGLDGGVLYSEWYPQSEPAAPRDRYNMIGQVSLYISARARTLRVESSLSTDLGREHRHEGFEVLASTLSGVYGTKTAGFLKRARLYHQLSEQTCPFPSLVDARMSEGEWIASPAAELLKRDFEHHGLGKAELSVTDPAYDLADAVLQFGLSRPEEARMLAAYNLTSGDKTIEERLSLYKLLAGFRLKDRAARMIEDPAAAETHERWNELYMNAQRFLTVHTARHCARWMNPRTASGWTSPLVVLGIGGIIDRRIAGFRSTTPAAIDALSLLHAHSMSVVASSGRAASDVKEYCDAFQLLGGIAEYGSVIYDAAGGRWKPLVDKERLAEMDGLRKALRKIPGVFVDPAHQYSIRTYSHRGGGTAPLPDATVSTLLATLKIEHLAFYQTAADTVIVADNVNKGKSLEAYLEYIGKPNLPTIAVGDSFEDLPLFRAASQSFAPAHIPCAEAARRFGCRTVGKAYQNGFLEIAKTIVHADGSRCQKCRTTRRTVDRTNDLLVGILANADRRPGRLLFDALTDPMSIRNFAH